MVRYPLTLLTWERGGLYYARFKTCRFVNFSKQMTSECDQIQDSGSARCILAPHKRKLSDSKKWTVGNANSELGKRGFVVHPVQNMQASEL